jgi:hypothetical protein
MDTLSAARAEASRINSARSRGPKSPEGKTRSAQNALKHGLRAEKFVPLDDEDGGAFGALAGALADDLAPVGALQAVLARRLVAAAWRLERADRIESELFALQAERSERGWGRLGLALVRDGNGPRAFDTLLRYRGSAMAELWRALRALKALQAQAQACEDAPDEVGEHAPDLPALREKPIEPEDRRNPGDIMPAPAPPAQNAQPDEPEDPRNPGDIVPLPPAGEPEARQPDAGRVDPEAAAPPSDVPCMPCVRAHAAAQKRAAMAQKCAIDAPPPAHDVGDVRRDASSPRPGRPGVRLLHVEGGPLRLAGRPGDLQDEAARADGHERDGRRALVVELEAVDAQRPDLDVVDDDLVDPDVAEE